MYCHDRFGLGHTTRTLRIASYLAENLADCSVLVLTDLSIIGRFKFPQNVDYVHLPGITQNVHPQYRAGTLNLEHENTIRIRRKITQSAAKTFQPNLFVIERDPFGLQSEMQRMLSFVREELPETKVIWGLPDVVGEPESVVSDWKREGVYQSLERFCDEIWVYGTKEIFDQAQEYQIPEPLANRVHYTGYLRSPGAANHRLKKDLGRMNPKKPFVLITAGSGAEGYALIDTYLRFLERAGDAVAFQSLIVTGPMMRSREKLMLKHRAQKLPEVIFHRFSKNILQYVKYATVVVCTGGYNTLCEILSYRKPAILVPFLTPPREHLLRARIFEKLGLVRLLYPTELAPKRIAEMVSTEVSNGSASLLRPRINIPLDGLENIAARIESLGGYKASLVRQAAS
ncbi:MAG: hypothetical protein ONB42_18330 [candidate division KSB1 bacterium]|nr:hypothetical protein [candidate division KSB1 bacterium]MDZ7311604.1 hypothetical protein [candidate division KSB1 bacterium]